MRGRRWMRTAPDHAAFANSTTTTNLPCGEGLTMPVLADAEHGSATALPFTYFLFVGSSQVTGELQLELVEKILSRRHEGFTILLGMGSWKGEKENCAVVIVSGPVERVMETILELKEELEQQAVGWLQSAPMQFV